MNIEISDEDYKFMMEVLDEALDSSNERLNEYRSTYSSHYKPHRVAYQAMVVSKTQRIHNLVEQWGQP